MGDGVGTDVGDDVGDPVGIGVDIGIPPPHPQQAMTRVIDPLASSWLHVSESSSTQMAVTWNGQSHNANAHATGHSPTAAQERPPMGERKFFQQR